MVGALAAFLLTRIESNTGDREQTQRSLERAADALDAYAATALRLPCPADPALDDGVELLLGGATCLHPDGVLPWKTIGTKRDAAFDSWGRKIFYRVYTNSPSGIGSLTQPNGASMVNCDTGEDIALSSATTTGLCRSGLDQYWNSTHRDRFLEGKHLPVVDMGTAPANVGYVLVSPGATGLGGYTASGVQLSLPNSSAERNNIRENGPFTLKAFSDSDTPATHGQHFDDLLVYRTIPDLARKTGLDARDWPEGAIFNSSTLQAATGSSAYGMTGTGSFSFMGNTYSAGGGNRVSFQQSGGVEGIGVGDAGETDYFIGRNEWIGIDLGVPAGKIGLALANFGHFTLFSDKRREQVQIRFFNGATPVGSVIRQACRTGGGLATMTVWPSQHGAVFNRVEIDPQSYSPNVFGASSQFLMSEFAACSAQASACTPLLGNPDNVCATPSLNSIALSPTPVMAGGTTQVTFTISNGTDSPEFEAMAFRLILPPGLAAGSPPIVQTNCPTGAAFSSHPAVTTDSPPEGDIVTVHSLSINGGVDACQVRFSVGAGTAGRYRFGDGQLVDLSNISKDISEAVELEVE